jgi:hypothetical protein
MHSLLAAPEAAAEEVPVAPPDAERGSEGYPSLRKLAQARIALPKGE